MPLPVGSDATPAPLDQSVVRALVESYLQQVGNPRFRPTRGLRLESSIPGSEVPPQRLELLASVLLPEPARAHIRQEDPPGLVVVPDGALHKLPFEALVFKSGPKPTYAIDELPPITYAPSVAILALLAERQAPLGGGPLSLLTVGDPAYRQGGRFPRLEHSATESRRSQDLFAPWPVRALGQGLATKEKVVARMAGRRIVHIAAHGLADQEFGNRFGALALTPRQGPPEDADFLWLQEIYNLPLKGCELAVLSACNTNVGQQGPLEAGITLASAFQAAGARRVVASHWEVHDASTAELMVAFFRKVTEAAQKGEKVSYARALQEARLLLRRDKDEKKSSPFHWAPFVLVGPPD
jgi:CHAT domain-containing protein